MSTETTDEYALAIVLRENEAEYEVAAATAAYKLAKRNSSIRAALEAGWSLQKIKDHTGLSRTRIQQIKNGGK